MRNGPRNSRMNNKGLFNNYEFLFVGEFGEDKITLSTIMELAALSGASLKNSPNEFTAQNDHKLIVFDETKMHLLALKAAKIRENSGIVCVNKSWLLDSLACFTILDTKPYETYT